MIYEDEGMVELVERAKKICQIIGDHYDLWCNWHRKRSHGFQHS